MKKAKLKHSQRAKQPEGQDTCLTKLTTLPVSNKVKQQLLIDFNCHHQTWNCEKLLCDCPLLYAGKD
jgi:hypothetical protein